MIRPILTLSEIALILLVMVGMAASLHERAGKVPHASSTIRSPEDTIADAQQGFQIGDCVRTIGPKTVLSDQAEGAPQFVVLDGALVSECFPELAKFRDGLVSTSSGVTPSSTTEVPSGVGTSLKTSVNVVPLGKVATDTRGMNIQVKRGSMATSSKRVPDQPASGAPIATSTQPSSPDSNRDLPSGMTGDPQFPEESKFSSCQDQVFGGNAPQNPTSDQEAAFENCLSN